jgi:hypothetical protein
VPVFLKKDLTDQMISLRKENFKYEDFARKSVQQLLHPETFKNTKPEIFNYTSSCIAINEGNGRFSIQRLPGYVQFSSVNAILCTDVNQDGETDLVLGGNQFGFQPQFSRLDASYGHVLLNNGKGQFEWVSPAQSGLEIRGEIRDIIEIPGKKSKNLLFLLNNDFPLMYRVKTIQDEIK